MLADREVNAEYHDHAALQAFAESVDVITLEFENIPAEVVDQLSAIKPVLPVARHCIFVNTASGKGLPQGQRVPLCALRGRLAASLRTAIETVGYPCVIKTAAFGYDGKGQIKINSLMTQSIAQPCGNASENHPGW